MSAKAQLIVIDRDGRSQAIDGEPGLSVMQILREQDFPIAAICGGCVSCATCHVYVPAEWRERLLPPDTFERDMLETLVQFRAGQSRLSCQIAFVDELDGITVTLAPEE